MLLKFRIYRRPEKRWYGEKSKFSLFMSVYLDVVWTTINGGNISFTRAQWENTGLQKGAARVVWGISKTLVFPRLIQPSAFISPKQSEQFFCCFLVSCSWQLFDISNDHTTVGIESQQPLMTFSVKENQVGLSLFLGITRKMVIFHCKN